MDTIRVALAALRTKRDKLQAEVDGLNAAISALGGSTASSASAPTRRRKRKLSPEQIKAMVEGRQRAREAKKADTPADDVPEPSPIAEARRKRAEATANTGHAQVRAASLAEAAS